MNGRSRRSGDLGEALAIAMLEQRGWKLIERQVRIHGHRIDALMLDPNGTEVLVQVKSWQGDTGRDTAKKDIADAWHLRYCGEQRPIVLVLTEPLRGVLRRMVVDAIDAGFYTGIIVHSITEFP
jgi:hypothetical protein